MRSSYYINFIRNLFNHIPIYKLMILLNSKFYLVLSVLCLAIMGQGSILLGLCSLGRSCCKIFLPTSPEPTTPSGGNSLLPSDPGAPLVPSSLILGMKVSKQTQTLFTVWIGGLNRGTWDREAFIGVSRECQSPNNHCI